MASTDRIQTTFRFLPDQMKRLAKAARIRGVSQNAFVEAAVLREISEVEESRQRGKIFEREERQESATRKPSSDGGSFSALTAALQKQNAATDTPATEIPQQPAPVVVNVGNNAHGASDIDRLASFVLAGSEIERNMRLQTAISILKDTTASEEERNTLAAKLDEAIAQKSNKPTPPDPNSNLVSRVARIGFDKISQLIK